MSTVSIDIRRGEIYEGIVYGKHRERVLMFAPSSNMPWLRIDPVGEPVQVRLKLDQFTITSGPLRVVEPGQVVLDLKGLDAGEYLHDLRAIKYDRAPAMSLECVAYIAAQIEAQTKPKVVEPGWGAVVEAGVEGREGRCLFSCVRANGVPMWQSQDGISWVVWASLIDPVVKRGAWVSMGWKEGLA